LFWRPDLSAGDICADSDSGSLALLDHAPGDWLLDPSGGGRDSVDVLTDGAFAQLKPLLEAALVPDRSAVGVQSWGFVSHLHEFMPGTTGSEPVSADALAAFDRWLGWVDRIAQDQIYWSTPLAIVQSRP
jgi:hypothetical protein